MTRKTTQADVFEAYRAAQQLGKTEFAHQMGMSKQSYSSYVHNKAQPELSGLQESAKLYVGHWIGDLCVDLLKLRGAAIPCVCKTEMWDCGACPKHGVPPTWAAIPKEQDKIRGSDFKVGVAA